MLKNICEQYDATTIQQLYKIITDNESGGYKNKNVFPVSLIQSIFDGITGVRLDQILSLFNCIYIPFKGTKEDTRLSINADIRRKGLIITFRDLDNNTYTQRYTYNDSVADDYWKDDENWEECFIGINNSDFINIIKEYIINYINENLIKVIDNLDSDDVNAALSAKQGKVLKNLIDNLQSIKFNIVDELPQQGNSNIIYLLLSSKSADNNKYEEYIWIADSNEYEKLGAIETTVDLSNYITTDKLNSTLESYVTIQNLNNTIKNYITSQVLTDTLQNYITTTLFNKSIVKKQDKLVSGTNIKTINNQSILGSGNIDIDKELPQDGNIGQVLTKTDNGVAWKTIQSGDNYPSGGTVGQVLKKTNNGVEWANDEKGFELPTGGTTGQVLKKTASGTEWADDNDTTYTKATTTTDGLMSKEDKSKLDNIAGAKTQILTKDEYDSLDSKDSDTIYFLKE